MAERLSLDHKGTDKLERDRIQAIGGFVTEKGRVMGDLAVARSLGDVSCSPYITFKPHVNETTITDDVEFLIIGCDGLFDVIEDQEACDLVKKYPKEKSSMVLRDFAYLFASADNISVIVIHFSKSLDRKSMMTKTPSWVAPSKSLFSASSPSFHKIFTPSRRKTFGEREVSFLRTINAEVKKSISLDNNPLEDEKNSGNDNKYNEGEIKLEEDSLNTSKNILTQSLPCQPIMSDDDDDSFDILSENVQIIAQTNNNNNQQENKRESNIIVISEDFYDNDDVNQSIINSILNNNDNDSMYETMLNNSNDNENNTPKSKPKVDDNKNVSDYYNSSYYDVKPGSKFDSRFYDV